MSGRRAPGAPGGAGGLRRPYGDGPLHAIAVPASFAIAAYAFLEIAERPAPWSFAIFFAGAIVAHDLLAFPIYSLLDRLASRTGSAAGLAGPAVNHVRIPALLSGFALIVWFPLVLGLAPERYAANSGHAPGPYLERWLLLTAALFIGSGLVYAIRRRGRGRGRATDRPGPRTRR